MKVMRSSFVELNASSFIKVSFLLSCKCILHSRAESCAAKSFYLLTAAHAELWFCDIYVFFKQQILHKIATSVYFYADAKKIWSKNHRTIRWTSFLMSDVVCISNMKSISFSAYVCIDNFLMTNSKLLFN